MIILGVDVETTGLEPKEDDITELGMVLWNTEEGKPVRMYNEYNQSLEKEIPEEIVKLTGITDSMCRYHGVPRTELALKFNDFAEQADYIMAHNAPFDRAFILENLQSGSDRKWLCSKGHIKYPEEFRSKSLVPLAAYHGFLNPFAHRAIFDVLTMLRVAQHYDWQDIVTRSEQPYVTIKAMVPFERKDEAKEAGFRWNPLKKIWWREMIRSELAEFVGELKFDVIELGERNYFDADPNKA